MTYKPVLHDAEEITDYIVMLSTEPIDEGLVEDYFWGCKAVLKSVIIDTLINDNPDKHIRCSKKEKEYERLPSDTMPPLIVENGIVMDGNHRLRVAKKKGMNEIKIYEVIATE